MEHIHTICRIAGIAAIGLLTACGTQQRDAALQEAGVSRELAQFRKEHFGQVKYNLFSPFRRRNRNLSKEMPKFNCPYRKNSRLS